MTTSPVMSVTDELIAELEAAAKAFDNLDFDSNTWRAWLDGMWTYAYQVKV
jgi:hypothetical protein